MKTLHWSDWTAFILVIIGALNWGLVGAFDFNLVAELFGEDSTLSNIIYILVGLAGIFLAVSLPHYTRAKTPRVE